MRLPTPLSRHKSNVHKNTFGHVLILAGSRNMLGAAALCSLAALRSGAGLVTLGIPKSLNTSAHKKISNCVMTLPLNETPAQTLSLQAFHQIQKSINKYSCIALGPGLSQNTSTAQLVRKIIKTSTIPLVIDADGLNALVGHLNLLTHTNVPKILTPHPGEMARLTGENKSTADNKRREAAKDFADQFSCTLLLKGHRTIVASPNKRIYTNKTGNAGLATAGSGDVLTGMIGAFIAQGLDPFQSAKLGATLHGKAGDIAARSKTRISMIASDIIDNISEALKGQHE